MNNEVTIKNNRKNTTLANTKHGKEFAFKSTYSGANDIYVYNPSYPKDDNKNQMYLNLRDLELTPLCKKSEIKILNLKNLDITLNLEN